jgi:hypothetical protein
MATLDELKKKFIVNSEEYEKEKLPLMIETMMNFCRIDETGAPHFENSKLNNTERIVVFSIARFIANKLNPKISHDIKLDEFATSLNLPKNVVAARITEIMAKNIIFRKDGSYSAYPYKISHVLDKLVGKYEK